MVARTLIIATKTESATGELSALGQQGEQLLIDRHIRFAQSNRREPLIVMGNDGDTLLRASRLVRNCEFVFDPNEEFGFISALKAGVMAVERPTFFASAHAPLEHFLTWAHFEGETSHPQSRQNVHLITEAPCPALVPEFPGLVTRKGVELLLKLSAKELQYFAFGTLCLGADDRQTASF